LDFPILAHDPRGCFSRYSSFSADLQVAFRFAWLSAHQLSADKLLPLVAELNQNLAA
jgi:hypothetical protein